MITAKQVRELITANPFKPFRVHLSDGSKHSVPHPEFAWVFGGSLFVGKPGTSGIDGTSHVRQLSILHISQVDFSTAKAPKRNARRRSR